MAGVFSLFSRDNSTALPASASWHADPAVRGTWGIVSACLSTLVICVWNAVHIDIPLRPRRWEFVDKLPWLAVGLLAPDYLLYVACCQLYHAKKLSAAGKVYLISSEQHNKRPTCFRRFFRWAGSPLSRQLSTSTSTRVSPEVLDAEGGEQERHGMEDIGTVELAELELKPSGTPPAEAKEAPPAPEANGSSVKKREHKWTLVHSFYASMGGFVVDVDTSIAPTLAPTSQLFPNRLQSGRARYILTARGVYFLMHHTPELVPDLSESSILNRCRSDALAKALLVAQLLYFCISCALRLGQSLSVSLLEVTTFAHAVCAVATYAVWWKKPFSVAEPTVITCETQGAEEIIAYLLMASKWTTARCAGLWQSSSPGELFFLMVRPAAGDADSGNNPSAVPPAEVIASHGLSHEAPAAAPSEKATRVGEYIFLARPDPNQRQPSSSGKVVSRLWRPLGGKAMSRPSVNIARWTLAARAMTRMGNAGALPRAALLSQHGGLGESVFGSDGPAYWWLVPGSIAAVYGLIHVAAWNASFPTVLEGLLWRTASFYALALGFAPSVVLQTLQTISNVASRPMRSVSLTRRRFFLIMRLISYANLYLLIVTYPIFTTYLLLESVRQILYLPADAFKLPDFSVYVPHFF
ncbi:uncharacterized protein PHACADRAFT_209692 [Phanerochaete carnosa HHB-10118-sp]|uniref:Uncharacterized protein n=1 Tax=Phanerochaete carnosa (strain HHB-10118-sp) TaxID=650164 RepID=K5V152_PHACS|nr:uncharacterized protein PHACADRAFT_209692 [Phanerochaete carnosa HHB-10118-sp]EKM56216.1 hypothetical protein PHACADRAFT_209692 [Phanerochaete carnosa HHB-10118-sp]